MDTSDNSHHGSLQPVMRYSCQQCSRRKVRCDKIPHPQKCSSCRKSGLTCTYPELPFPKRQRKVHASPATTTSRSDLESKLARYERILDRHGLLSSNESGDVPLESRLVNDRDTTLPSPISQVASAKASTSHEGVRTPATLITNVDRTRYVELNDWHSLGDDLMPHMSDDEASEGPEDVIEVTNSGAFGDAFGEPLSMAAFGGHSKSLLHHHPSHEEAMWLWKTYVERVEPTCKLLHVPSTADLLATISTQPSRATRPQECLLFAIYHFAVSTLDEEELRVRFRRGSKTEMLRRLRSTCEQALVNVSWLQTRKIMVLQAAVLFLLACRYHYDPQTYWVLTGVVMRIAQRIGIHRDGEKLSLSPFDTHIRRLLYNQVLPLDGLASSMAGTRLGALPDDWDSKLPWNVNDDQVWPGMTEVPEEKEEATELVFCLTRASLGFASVRTAKMRASGASQDTIDAFIDEVERNVHEKYIRHCDMIDPLHFLTICLSRAGFCAMRLRPGLARVRNRTATSAEKRHIFELAQKIIDIDIAAHANTSLPRYRWQARSFFAWGLWDSLTYTLLSLGSRYEALSRGDIDAAWARIQRLFANRDHLQLDQVLHVAIGRLTLKAWEANPSSDDLVEPEYISTLKSLLRARRKDDPGDTIRDMGAETGNVPILIGDNVSDSSRVVDGHTAELDMMDFLTDDFQFESLDPDFRVQWLSCV